MNAFFDTLKIREVHLRVMNLETVRRFYRDVIGLQEIAQEGSLVRLSADGREPALIVLEGSPGTKPRRVTAPGLFHTAFLFPRRSELARTVRHVGEMGWRFQGFADHGVSEAVYLADPEGNGVELYTDRPRERWPVDSNGIAMVTEPLDVPSLLQELTDQPASYIGVHRETIIGHLHLQVSDLLQAETFYHGALGLDVTQRNYPGALFLAANGYHHHIGLNTWNSRGFSPSADKTAGLVSFSLEMDDDRLATVADRLSPSGKDVGGTARTFQVNDPHNISLKLSPIQDSVGGPKVL